jgi:hypothetical protein
MDTSMNPGGMAPPLLLNGEPLLTLAAAGRLFPGYRANRHTNPSTIFRWITRGARAADGTTVRLEAVRAGHRWLTSAEAVGRFVGSLTAGGVAVGDRSAPRSPAARRQADKAAAEELDRLGL